MQAPRQQAEAARASPSPDRPPPTPTEHPAAEIDGHVAVIREASRGRGTRAARRRMNPGGDKGRCVAPPCQVVFRWSKNCPASLHRIRSRTRAGRVMQLPPRLQRPSFPCAGGAPGFDEHAAPGRRLHEAADELLVELRQQHFISGSRHIGQG